MRPRLKRNRVLGVFGIGGHGRECSYVAEQTGYTKHDMVFVVDPEFLYGPSTLHGIPVISSEQFSLKHPEAPLVLGVGNPRSRRNLARRFQALGHSFPTLVSPRAAVHPSAAIGEGCIIFQHATVSLDVELCGHNHLNTHSSISHDSILGCFSTLGPHAAICGHVKVGDQVEVGAAACIINGTGQFPIEIGSGVVIGASACVIRSVGPNELVVGVPATSLRSLPNAIGD